MHQLDWNATIDSLRDSLPQAQFQNWLRPVEFLRANDTAIVLGVPSRFHEEWVRNHYSSQITKAIQKQCGANLQLEFEVLVQEENIEAALAPVPPAVPSRPTLRVVPSPAEAPPHPEKKEEPQLPMFSSRFMDFPFNHVAYQCSALFAEGRNLQVNPLVILGGIGMGKTHLLADIGQRVRKTQPEIKVRYTNAETFTAEMVQGFKSNTSLDFKKKYRHDTDLLLFDDVHLLTRRLKTQEELLHIFNEIVSRGGRVAFSTSVPPQRLEDFIEPMKSRLLSGLISEIKPPSFEDRVSVLTAIADLHQIKLEAPVLRLVADRGQKDVRELIGSLLRSHLQAKLENRPIDANFLAEGGLQESSKAAITMSEIVALVEHNFAVAREELMSKSRKGTTNWARQVAMYLARHFTLLPLEEIGKTFGRDHATVIHAFQKVRETMKDQPTRQYEVEFLMQKLQTRAPRPMTEPTFQIPGVQDDLPLV